MGDIEKHYTDQELQAAYDHFKDGIGLNQFLLLGAEANGYRGTSGGKMTLEAQRAAFRLNGQRQIHATGFSTIEPPWTSSSVRSAKVTSRMPPAVSARRNDTNGAKGPCGRSVTVEGR